MTNDEWFSHRFCSEYGGQVVAPLVLLDLDGTLMDSAPGITQSVQYAYAKLGIPVPDDETLRSFVGPPITESFLAHGVPADLVTNAVSAYREEYEKTGLWNNSVFDGIFEQLTRLRNAGCVLAIATAKPTVFAADVCDRFGLSPLVDGIFGNTLVEGLTKGDVIDNALKAFDRDAIDGAAIMVGDREHDVHGAADHGLPCLGVAWGYAAPGELENAGAVALVATVPELATTVLEHLGRHAAKNASASAAVPLTSSPSR